LIHFYKRPKSLKGCSLHKLCLDAPRHLRSFARRSDPNSSPPDQFHTSQLGKNIMYKLVILSCVLAAAAGAVVPAVGYAVNPLTPQAIPHAVPAAVSHSLGLPEAAGYVLPPVRQVQEAPIVEQSVEPVEQWGYKVAY